MTRFHLIKRLRPLVVVGLGCVTALLVKRSRNNPNDDDDDDVFQWYVCVCACNVIVMYMYARRKWWSHHARAHLQHVLVNSVWFFFGMFVSSCTVYISWVPRADDVPRIRRHYQWPNLITTKRNASRHCWIQYNKLLCVPSDLIKCLRVFTFSFRSSFIINHFQVGRMSASFW